VINLLISPLVYFFWRLLIKITELLSKLTRKLHPPKMLSKKGCILIILSSLWVLPWAIIFGITSLIHIFLKFIVDLPFRFLSEKLIKRVLLKVLHKIASTENEMRKWYFKKQVYIGFLFLIFGFFIQIVAFILQNT